MLSVPPVTASDCPFGIFWSLCYSYLHLQLLIAPLVSFGDCVIRPSSYGFWLPLWYLLVIVLSLPPFTASDYPFGIFWSLCYLSLQLQLLIAPLLSFGHCVIRPSIYSFWLPLCYLLVIVLSVPPFTASDCPFGIFWSLCYSYLQLQLLIAPLVSFGHCVIRPSIYGFWLPLWYLLVIVLSVPPFTASDCPFGIFWSLCYLSLHLQLLIAPLISFGHCVIRRSIYSFWLPLWYLLVIVLSVPPFTASDCPFGIFWSLCYPSLQLQLLIAPLVSFGHCVIRPSSYGFWLPLWYLLVIVLSVPPFTASDCPFGIFWSLCYLSLQLQLLIAPLISFGHCVIGPSSYGFWLPLWYLLVIVLSVPPFTASDCPFDIFWSLCYLSLQLQLLIAPLVSFGHCVISPSIYSFWLPLWYLLVIVLSVPPFTASDCPFDIFWSLCYPSLHLQLLIAPLISFGHCVFCPSIYSFWLPLWYLLVIVLSVPPFTASDCPFDIFWSLCYPSLHLQLLIAPLVSFGHCVICPSIYSFWLPLWYLLVIVLSVPPFTASDCPFGIFWSLCYLSLHLQLLIAPLISFGHCVICPSIYSFWLPLWYLLVIVLSVPPFTASDCPFDIFWSLCYLSLHLQLLIAPLISFGHCVIRPSSYGFWLPLWYLLVIVLSLPPFTASDCPFGIFWSLCYRSLHYSFWLPLWYLLVIVLSVPPFTASDCPFDIFWSLCYRSLHIQSLQFTASDCPFDIFWSLCYLSLHLQLLIAPLISFGHCVICPSIYSFWLPLWYLLVIVLSVPPFTASDCPFGIFWSLCYPSLQLQLLIAPLVSFGHCVICPSIYSFWLPLWYLLVIVLSVPPFTASDCPFAIFWSLCYPSLQLQLLIAPLISFGHCVIGPSIYSFWLPLWYLLVIVLSVPPVTASDCPFGIFWSLCYLSLHLQLLIAPLISFGHCVIGPSIYSFWLSLWYLLVIVLSVHAFTASDCPFDIFWSLCYPFLQLQLLIAPLVSFGHCVICPSICSFWLPLWYLLVIVLSVPPVTASDCPFDFFWSLCYRSLQLRFWLPLWYLLVIVLSVPPFTASDCPFGIFWSLCYRPSSYSFWLPLWYLLVIVLYVPPFTASGCPFDIFWSLCYPSLHLQLLIAPLVSFCHCVICASIYSFWLPLGYHLVIVLSVPPFTASDCPFEIVWSLCYLSIQLQFLNAPLISFGYCVIRPSIYSFWLPPWYLFIIVLSVPPFTASDCPFDIFSSLCYLSLHLQLLIAPLISFGHCVIRPSSYSFWLHLWYLLIIVLSVPPFTASDCPFDIFWSLCYLYPHLQLLIALWYLLVIVLFVPPFTSSDCPLISFGHCVICTSSYNFWLPLWYLLVIVLSVPPFTSCDCPFGIFWSLCYLYLHLQLLIAPLLSFGHCVIRPSIYSFWLPLWYLLVIVLSVPPFTASDCPFEIVWSLCYLSLQLQLLIAPLISFGHCVICPSSYGFWLPLWYLLVIVLSVPPFTASDCPFAIFWSLCYPSLHVQLLIAPVVSFGHCVIRTSIYSFWLPLCYLLVIVLSVPPFTASDCPFGIFWSLCYPYLHLQLLIATLVSFGHCVIRPSSYGFWLPLWYLLVIVLSVPPVTASDCPFGIFWSLCYPYLHLQLLIAPLVAFGHCVIRPSSYCFWLPLWFLLVIVLSLPPFTASDCPFEIVCSLCYLSLQLQLLIAPLVSFGHCVICPSSYSFWLPFWYLLVIVLFVPPFTASDCPFGIFWSLCYPFLQLRLLITPLVSFGHCVISPSIYSFWLPLWYLLVIVLSVPAVTASDCPLAIFWSLCYPSLHLQLLISPLVSFGHCVIRTSIYSFWLPLWYLLVIVLSVPPVTASDCPFGIFWSLCYPYLHLQLLIAPLVSFGHCVIRPSSYGFWWPLWYLLVIVLSLPPFTASDCPFGIFWSLCYLSLQLQLLNAPLISFGHCVIGPSSYGFWLPLWYLLVIVFFGPSIYSFWLSLWYLLVIVLSVPPFTASDCPFDIFWSLCYRSLHIQLLIVPLISFGHCVICPSIYSFWLPLWYLLVIVLSFLQLQLLIAPLVSFGHCVICPSSYSFWLPLWYLLVIVLSVPPVTASDCPFDIFWSLCYRSLQLRLLIAPLISFCHCVICPSIYSFWLPLWYLLVIVLSSLQLQLLIAPLVSFGHCVICPSIYSFWLPLWYRLAIVLSVPPFTASDCPFGIFLSLCYLCLHLQLLIAPLLSFGQCFICPSIYSFWLPLWNCLVIVLSVHPVTVSECPFDIFWLLCYTSLHLQLLIAPLVSFHHCVICPSSYSFWMPLCYLLVIVLSVPPFTASDCPFGIFWSLCYPYLHLQLLIAPLVSFGHCVIRPSSYGFWLPLWYLLVIVLSVHPVTASDCPFGIFWSLCYLSLHLQLLIAPLLSFGHCVIRPSIYSFWLPLWYLLVIVLSVPPFTASDCPFGIFWSLCYPSLQLRLLIAPLVSFGHCVICPSSYSFWLPLWYLLVIVLSVPPFTASDCPFGSLWSLCYPSLQLLLLIAPLVSFGHCVISPSIYSFWLPLWNSLVIVLSVPPVTASDCPFGIFWSLCYSYLHLQLLIAPLVSFGHCVIRPSSYGFWLPLWYLLVIVLSLPPFTASDYPFGIFWSLCYLSLQLQLLIAPLLSFGHCVIRPSIYSFWFPLCYLLVIVLSVPPFTASDCPFGIFWSLCYSYLHLQLLIAPLVSFGHCVIRPSSYGFWLPLWYLLVIVLSLPPFTASDCPFGIFWSLCYLSLQLQLLIAPLISFGHCVIRRSIYSFWFPLWYLLVIVLSVPPFTASDCPFGIFWSLCYPYLHLQLLIAPLVSFGHCVIRPSSYGFWLPLWYLLVIVLSLPPFTASDCPFGIFWSLCYLSLQLQLLIAPLISFGHCVIGPSSYGFWLPLWYLLVIVFFGPSIYSFWLSLWYLLVIVLSVHPFTASDCPFDIFWSLCYRSLQLQLLIASLVSFGHCVICPSIYSFWLPLCYLLNIVLSVPPFTASDCPFDIFWSLCHLSLHLQLLIAPLISFGHCVICPSIYSFWLPLCYLLVIVLSVPPFTASDYPFDIFWSFCHLSLHLQLLIAPLVSFGHCVIRPSSYGFWLPLWYLLVIVLSLPPFTASDCPFGIFWSLCYRSLHIQLLIVPLISFGHCVICPSIYSWLPLWYLLVIVLSVPPYTASDCPFDIFGHCVICPCIYSFWLPLWYLLVIVLSVPPVTASDCPFDIFWSLCYLPPVTDCPFDIFWSLCYLSLHLQLLIAPLVSFGHFVIVPPVTASDCPFGIFWSLCYPSLHLQLLIAPLISFGHCVIPFVPPFTASDCPFAIFWSLCYPSLHLQLLITPLISFGHFAICPSIYSFWLPLWYLLVIVLSVPPVTASDCPFGIFWSLCYLSLHLQLLIAPLVSFGHCVICPSSYSFWLPLWYLLVIVLSVPPVTASDCPFDIFWSLCYRSLHVQLLIVPLISFGHCVICPSIYSFWLPLWYLLVIVLSVPPYTASDCPFDIFWSLCYLSMHLQLLIAPLISFGHCVIRSSSYSFWLPLWYLLVIVLSVPPFTASDCPFGIFWSLCYLSLQLQLLIAPLISFGHCVIGPSSYGFWLPLWYLLVIVLFVPPFTASDCPFGIFWWLCYPSLQLRLLIAPLVSFGHCVISPSIYSFWLPLWYLLVIVLSVPAVTASDCPFAIFWSLCYPSLHLQLLISPLLSFGHCVIRTSIYSFWLPLWYLLVIVLFVPPFTASDCPFGIFWSLCYPSLQLRLLIAPLVSFGHCVISPSIYSFWLPLWYLLVIVLSVPPVTASDCPFDIFWSLCYPSLHLQLLISTLVSFGHCVIRTSIYSFWLPLWYLLVIVLSVPPFTASDCPFGIFWSLCYPSLQLRLLIAPLVSFGHCVISPSIYSFWLPLWYLLVIVLSVPPVTASDCPFDIFWSLCYRSLQLRLLIAPLISFGHCVFWSLHIQLLIVPLISFGHCVICPSIYSFWLPLWYLLVIVLSVPPVTASDCLFGIFWSLCYLSLHLQLLIAPLLSFEYCVIRPSIYSFWLPLWYLLVIVPSVTPFTASDCPFDIFWSLCYLSLHLQLLIAPLLSFGHCVIRPSIYSFWLPLWYLLVILPSVPPFTASDCPFGIFWSLCYPSLQLRLLIAPLVSFGHCVISPSIYSFWLPLWYLLVIVLSVPPYTASDCPFDIFWSLCYLSLHLQVLIAPLISFGHCVIGPSIYSFWLSLWYLWSLCYLSMHLQLLIAPLISFGHCVIRSSSYSFWLPLWYLLVIVLSVPPVTLLIAPLISFGHCVICPSIYSFWLPLWYLLVIVLSSLQLQLLIAPLVSFGHCVICPSIYSFWLPLWYLLVFVPSVTPFTASDCPFDIFWSLCYLSLHLQLLIAPLLSFGHCVIRPSIYSFWLPLWYLLVILPSVPPFTASDCPFGIFWSLCYPSLQLRLMIAPLVSFGHCVISPSIYSFWLPLWYLLVIVLSVPPVTASDCPFDIFWSLCYRSLQLRLLIAPLISFGHCVIGPSIYSFWLSLWYLLVIVLSVPPFTASDCPFDIFWSLCYRSLHIQLLIVPLISFGHCVICPCIYSFWLPLWYLLVIVLSVPPVTASDCPFGIFWSLCYLSLHLQLLIAPLVSFGHCVICPSSYSFWLPLWYLLVIVLSVPPVTASDCPFDIFWSLCYLSLHL